MTHSFLVVFADINFEPLVPENAHLQGHISQRSNLLYVKIVVEHFDERQREDFCNSCLGFLLEVGDLRVYPRDGIKVWSSPDDNIMERVLDKRRLKDKYGHSRLYPKLVISLVSVLVNVPTTSQLDINKVAIAAYLHVYVTLHPTEVERGQLHITTLVLFDDRSVPALDGLASESVAPQFYEERLGTPEEGTFEDKTSDEAHEGSGTSGKEEESGTDDSEEAKGEDSKDHDSRDSDGDRV
ncbi:Hypothetical predicted protein [Olea europaea subsp. europaea]|uniref:Uncharacterized protein n=1 Tax=Olea europaea subsp. europaea TaxID=158383 RepID=A0A8S0VH70_OLEEU|nr:Hypothetical predicted protein [Olea europaea subsp. europaea]